MNVDTDQIIPKQFLKRIEQTRVWAVSLLRLAKFATDGKSRFVLDEPRYEGASILVAGKNFGCGSSREHAVWALADFGFRAVIGTSFADIFANNSTKNGFLTVILREDEVAELMKRAQRTEGLSAHDRSGAAKGVRRAGLLGRVSRSMTSCAIACSNGLDDIGLTLQHEAEIASYEARHPAPWSEM